MRASDLMRRLADEPFRPFRIHLSDGTSIDVRNTGMVIVGRSSAVMPTAFEEDSGGYRIARDWRTIALRHMVQFSDLSGAANGRRRSRP